MPGAIDPSDIIGKRFGKLVVKAYKGLEVRGKKTKSHIYLCDCDCGSINVEADRQSLRKGSKTSCGCAHQDAGNAVLEDLTGQRFGRWTVIDRAPNRISKSGITRSIMWHCRCDCGTEKNVGARALKTGMSTSCGCLQKERVSQALTDDLTGQQFAHLTVMYRNGSRYPTGYGKGRKCGVRAVWHCECDCGNECDAVGESLKNGDVTSCGCSNTLKYEMYVARYLDEAGILYEREKTFDGLVGLGGSFLRFDFCARLSTGETVLIECQGEQHNKSVEWFGGDDYFEKVKAHDDIKRRFAVEHGFRLIEIQSKCVTYQDVTDVLKSNKIV